MKDEYSISSSICHILAPCLSLSLSLSLFLCLSLYFYFSVCLSLSLYVCLSLICLFLSFLPSLTLSLSLSRSLPLSLTLSLSLSLSISLPIFLSVSLPPSLTLSPTLPLYLFSGRSLGLLYIRPAHFFNFERENVSDDENEKENAPDGIDAGAIPKQSTTRTYTHFSSEPINLMRLVIPRDRKEKEKEKERARSPSPSGSVLTLIFVSNFSNHKRKNFFYCLFFIVYLYSFIFILHNIILYYII